MFVFTLLSLLAIRKCILWFIIGLTLHSLSPLDVEVMKRLGSRVNLIPVIAKADTLTPSDLAKFKQNVIALPPPPLSPFFVS